MIQLIGRLHPLLVHLPIGILMIGLLLFWRNRLRGSSPDQVIPFIFLMAAVAALLSCISGYLLSTSSDEYGAMVINHRNAAILLTTLTALFWWLLARQIQPMVQQVLSIILLALLIITGHQGGSLTHGEGYLWRNEQVAAAGMPVISDINQAILYKDIIAPILSQKCVSCHGPNKQKGKLRLDDEDWIVKGGKSGNTLKAGNLETSEIIKRIVLPPDDEDHMPPKEKGQLTGNQVALIKWWVQKGASFSATVKELVPDVTIQPALNSLMQKNDKELTAPASLPIVDAAPDQPIRLLQSKGVMVIPIAQGSNLLNVNFINCPEITDSMLTALKAIAPQLYWVKAEGPIVNDKLVSAIAEAKHLKRISLAGSRITPLSKPILDQLKQLEQVNVYQTTLEKKQADATKRP